MERMKYVLVFVFAALVWAIGIVIATPMLEGVWLFAAGGMYARVIYQPLVRWAEARLFHAEHE